MKVYALTSESDLTSREQRRVDAYSRAISRPLDMVHTQTSARTKGPCSWRRFMYRLLLFRPLEAEMKALILHSEFACQCSSAIIQQEFINVGGLNNIGFTYSTSSLL